MKTRSKMPRLGVVVIDPAAKILKEVEVCLQEFVGWQFQGEFQGIEYLAEQMPAVIMADLDAGLEGTFEVVAEIRSAAPRFVRPPVLLGVTEKGKDHGEEWLFRCVRAGFQDFLDFPFDRNDVADVLSRIEDERGEGRRRGGKVVTLFGACGGSGLTTLAVNLGIILAKQRNKKVGLIDLELELGDLSFILNVSPKMTIADIADDALALDPNSLHKALVRHVSGIDVLAAPAQIEEADNVSEDRVGQIIQLMRERFEFVLIDTPRNFSPITLEALDSADIVLLITTPKISAVVQAKRIGRIFTKLGCKERTYLVINEMSQKDELTTEEIEKVMGMSVFMRLPSGSRKVIEANKLGLLLWDHAPGSKVIRATGELAEKILELEEATSKRG